jgi:hypothetical protein
MASNPVCFKYTLVIGRRGDFENDPAKVRRFASLNDSKDVRVWTYDSVLSDIRNGKMPYQDLNLLARYGYRFRFKHYVPEPAFLWDEFTPD